MPSETLSNRTRIGQMALLSIDWVEIGHRFLFALICD
jgi:hypothetical protein